MKWTFLPLLLCSFGVQAQTIDYQWLNEPCASLLNCDTGCTACNSARNANSSFTGTDVAWIGVDVCPHPVSTGNNTLFTSGWPAIADEDHMMLVSGIAFTPVHLDSIVIRHRSGVDGPQRLRIRFGVDQNLPGTEWSDVSIPSNYTDVVLTDLGEVSAGVGMVYGYFTLILQPYLGNGGDWELDDLHIAASPMVSTSIQNLGMPRGNARPPRYDALGRALIDRPDPHFYIDGTKRVILY